MRLSHSLCMIPAVCFSQAPAPQIHFENTHHDFGRLSEDQKVSHRYKVTNRGSALLQIKEIIPSCGCSYSVPGQWQLAPGEETFIEVQFDPEGMTGNVRQSLTVNSNDLNSPSVLLTFEATVIREIMPSASALFFDRVSRSGPPQTKTIRLSSGNGQPVAVSDARAAGAPYLSCSPQKDGNDMVLNVRLDGQQIPKQSNRGVDTLTVRTSSAKAPVLHFHIQWDVIGAIDATPARISWVDAPGKEQRATIRIKHAQGRPFRILEAKASIPQLTVAGLGKNSAAEHQFEVVLSARTNAGGYSELITLSLDDPEQQTLEVPVVIILR